MPPKKIKIYQLKISLNGSQPLIWRRVQVQAAMSLARLHEVIQASLGWRNQHRHAFLIGDQEFNSPAEAGAPPSFEEQHIHLYGILPGEGRSFIYLYDFGDGWEHTVEVEKMLDSQAEVRYPRCLEGEQSCPPEGSGGLWGYYALRQALEDPDHEDYERANELFGPNDDPQACDLEAINEKLKEL